MENSRERIVSLLQLRGRATAEELASALGLAPATVRRHLDILQRDALAAYEPVHKRSGRPHYAYFLTEAGQDRLPKDYHRLADWLLEELGGLSPEEMAGQRGEELRTHLLRRVAEHRASAYQSRLAGLEPEKRLSEVGRILNEENFRIEIHDEPGGLLLYNYNCPFHRIAGSHKELCSLDLHFIEDLLQAHLRRQRCIADGDDACVYLVEV